MVRRGRGVGALALLALMALSAPARAQDAKSYTFNLHLFRPSVDSKGYITVNASQILGHLDFSIGLVGTWAHNVLNLSHNGNSFDVNELITPQIQAALGLFKWIEVGVSLRVGIMYGGRSPGYKSPTSNNLSNDLSFSGQFVGDVGIHLKGRFLNTSKYPVGLGLLTSIYTPSGDSKKFLGDGQVTIRPEIIVDREWGFTRRIKTALNIGALIRPSRHTFNDNGTVVGQDPNVAPAGGMPKDNFCQPAPLTPPFMQGEPMGTMHTAPPPGMCGTGRSRTLGTQLTYGL